MSEDEGADGSERRRSLRQDTAGTAQAALSLEAEVLNLSERGMLVGLAVDPGVGTQHALTLRIDSATLELLGIVRNVEGAVPGSRNPFRVGVEFLGLTPDQASLLGRFVAARLSGGS